MLLSNSSELPKLHLQLTIAQQQLDQLQVENAKLVEQNRNFKAKCKKSHNVAIQTDMVCLWYYIAIYVHEGHVLFVLKNCAPNIKLLS